MSERKSVRRVLEQRVREKGLESKIREIET